jgi:hypothetical protein
MSLNSLHQLPYQPSIAAFPPEAAIWSEGSIPIVGSEIAVVQISKHLKAAQLAALLDAPTPVEPVPWLEPLGWAQAVRVAVARLKSKFVVPPDDGDPALMAMAQQLAAFLCAYGKLDDDADLAVAKAKAADKVGNPMLFES